MKKICSLTTSSSPIKSPLFEVSTTVLTEDENVQLQRAISDSLNSVEAHYTPQSRVISKTIHFIPSLDGITYPIGDNFCKENSASLAKIAAHAVSQLEPIHGPQVQWTATLFIQELKIPSLGMIKHKDHGAVEDGRVTSLGTAIHYLHTGEYDNDKLSIFSTDGSIYLATHEPQKGDTVVFKQPLFHAVSPICHKHGICDSNRFSLVVVFHDPNGIIMPSPLPAVEAAEVAPPTKLSVSHEKDLQSQT